MPPLFVASDAGKHCGQSRSLHFRGMARSSKHGPEDLEERQEVARAVAAAKEAAACTRAAAAAQVAHQRKESRVAKAKDEQLRSQYGPGQEARRPSRDTKSYDKVLNISEAGCKA